MLSPFLEEQRHCGKVAEEHAANGEDGRFCTAAVIWHWTKREALVLMNVKKKKWTKPPGACLWMICFTKCMPQRLYKIPRVYWNQTGRGWSQIMMGRCDSVVQWGFSEVQTFAIFPVFKEMDSGMQTLKTGSVAIESKDASNLCPLLSYRCGIPNIQQWQTYWLA